MCRAHSGHHGVASVSRIDEIIGLFCKRALYKRRYSAKETYTLIDPTNRSHPSYLIVSSSSWPLPHSDTQIVATMCSTHHFQELTCVVCRREGLSSGLFMKRHLTDLALFMKRHPTDLVATMCSTHHCLEVMRRVDRAKPVRCLFIKRPEDSPSRLQTTHIHAHTHIRIRTHTHRHTDTRTHTYTFARAHTHIHTYAHTYTHTLTRSLSLSVSLSLSLSLPLSLSHSLSHTHSHTRTHTQTFDECEKWMTCRVRDLSITRGSSSRVDQVRER